MNINWRTNLPYVMNRQSFPAELKHRPMVGDIIDFQATMRFQITDCIWTNIDTMTVWFWFVEAEFSSYEEWERCYKLEHEIDD